MTKRIWKYDVDIGDEFDLELPKQSEILDVGMQRNVGRMWILVEPDNEHEKRKFKVFGTGHPIDDTMSLEYVGTVVSSEDMFVWHIFEDKEWEHKL